MDSKRNECMEGLAPEVKAFLKQMEKAGLPPLSPENYMLRRRFVDSMAERTPVPSHGLKKIEDRSIRGSSGEILVRIYTPEGDKPLPILLFCHGGGWVVGSLAMEEHICLSLAEETPCIVVSVDYRLAPEHPFPAALNDCYDTLLWTHAMAGTFGGDGGRIGVSGESAGANIVAATLLLSKERGGPLVKCQALFNPVTDLTGFNTESHKEFGQGFILTREDMEATSSLYVPDEKDRSNPYVSPLLAPDLTGLPAALIITSRCDPLRDEGEAYAKRLEEAGVPVRLTRYDDMVHGFLYFFRSGERAKQALREASVVLREAFRQ